MTTFGHEDGLGCLIVDDSLYARALAPFLAEVERLRPANAEVLDAHAHLGLDEDGRSLSSAQLLSMLDAADARRACVFPLHDPERDPAYRVPNDRVLAWARETDSRLIPFCRLDPSEDPLAESERCLAAGARGIKLHPRAQDFDFDGREMDEVFALAEMARVPILIHAGRGLPPLAEGLVDLALRHPEAVLILATLAQRFRPRIAPDCRVEPQAIFTLRAKYGMHMQIAAREAQPQT